MIPGLIVTPASYWLFFLFSRLSHVNVLRHAYIKLCDSMWGNQRQSWILDSTPWILDSDYWIPDLSVDLDSRFQLSVRCRIPTAVFRIGRPRIPDSTSKKFPRFPIPQAKIALIPLHGENCLSMQPVWYAHFDTISYVTFRILLWLVHDYLSHCKDINYTIVVRKANWTSKLSWAFGALKAKCLS